MTNSFAAYQASINPVRTAAVSPQAAIETRISPVALKVAIIGRLYARNYVTKNNAETKKKLIAIRNTFSPLTPQWSIVNELVFRVGMIENGHFSELAIRASQCGAL